MKTDTKTEQEKKVTALTSSFVADMKNIKFEHSKLDFSATICYPSGTYKVNYDLSSFKWFIAEEIDEEATADSGVNEIDTALRSIQTNLSCLYIKILEFIAEGKITTNNLKPHNDDLTFINNQLKFLDRMARAFQEIKVTCIRSEEEKVA